MSIDLSITARYDQMEVWFSRLIPCCIRSVLNFETDMVPDLSKDRTKVLYTQMHLALANIGRCVSDNVRLNTLTTCIE